MNLVARSFIAMPGNPQANTALVFSAGLEGTGTLLKAWDWVSGLRCHVSIFLVLNTRTMEYPIPQHIMMGFPLSVTIGFSLPGDHHCRDVSCDRVLLGLVITT
jgi:hypothetical protein